MRRIAIFSDIHGNIYALQDIIQNLKKEKVDEVFCLGDVIGIGPNSKECLNLIKENNIRLLLGNHEVYFLNDFKENEIFMAGSRHIEHHKWIAKSLDNSDREFLKNCSLDKVIKDNGVEIRLNHFFLKENIKNGEYPFWEVDLRNPENREDSRINSNIEYNFFGHIHKRNFFEKKGKKYYCVGSSGCVKNDKTFYTIISIKREEILVEVKEIVFDRVKFDNSMKLMNYPEKEEIYNRFFS